MTLATQPAPRYDWEITYYRETRDFTVVIVDRVANTRTFHDYAPNYQEGYEKATAQIVRLAAKEAA